MNVAAPLLSWLFVSLFTLIACGGHIGNQTQSPSLDEIEASGHRLVETRVTTTAPLVALINATVLTATGARYSPGHVVFDDRIRAVGPGHPPEEFANATHIDAAQHVVTPGLIDTHSHLGVYASPGAKAHSDGNEMTNPVTPGVWAEHSTWPQDPGLELAIAGGITTLQILPGSGNLIGGRGVVLHMVPHRGSRAMRLPGAPDTLKMACGENPKRVYGKRKSAPSTRMGNLRAQRQAFANAQSYVKRLNKGEPPARDLNMETLAGVLAGKILPHVHCYRADDMLSFLQVADEFGFRVRSFHHALEAYKIRDILAEKEVSVSTWADWWGFKMEAYDGVPGNAAMVHAAGGRAIIHSDSAIGIQRLNQEAAKAMHTGQRIGLSVGEDAALRWITLNPAWALGVDDQVGSLEVGKRADLVVWDKTPFSVYASARWVFVDGHLRHNVDRDDPPWSDFVRGQEVTP
jgi:imidazolonepropionase-like amidohydrolase